MAKPAKKVSLGRGLSSLLGPDLILNQDSEVSSSVHNSITALSIEKIQSGKYQPRTYFQEEELIELAESIKEIGILQPILVRKVENDQYEIIAGERRWRAAQRANLIEVPVIIKDFTDQQASEAALIENIQRDDLTPLEEAQGYNVIIEEFGYTQEQLSAKIGKSRSHIANTLRLLSLPESIKILINQGKLTAGHARALLKSDNPEALAKEIIEKKLNVRDVEKRNKPMRQNKHTPKAYQPKDEDIQHLEEQMLQILGMHTQIQLTGESGQIIISFATLQELDSLIGKLSQAA